MSHPRGPSSDPALIEGFVFDAFKGFVNKAVVGRIRLCGSRSHRCLGRGMRVRIIFRSRPLKCWARFRVMCQE